MKSTGIVRKIDSLGRLVLPKEIRKTLGIPVGTPVGIYTEGENIIVKKYEPACIFCGEASNVSVHMGKNICVDCMKEIQRCEI